VLYGGTSPFFSGLPSARSAVLYIMNMGPVYSRRPISSPFSSSYSLSFSSSCVSASALASHLGFGRIVTSEKRYRIS
jgi:hypothetical protein